MIRLGFCFDLLDPPNVRYLKEIFKDYEEALRQTEGTMPTNVRHHRRLDYAVFQYAYAIVEGDARRSVDCARAVYVPTEGKKRVWKGSWIFGKAHIQICMRNLPCVLGTWLHLPVSQENSDGLDETETANFEIEPENQASGKEAKDNVD